jgi:hypothetical protein
MDNFVRSVAWQIRLFRKVAWELVLLPSNRLDGDILFARSPSLPSGIGLFVPF